MNPAAVRRFIDVTHETYRKRIGAEFGEVVPGIFTDEPNYRSGGVHRQYEAPLPWTAKLPAIFRKRYGYDILARLPALYFDVDGASVLPARRDYYDCVTHLFVDAFARQIGEWCEAHNMQHTGHVLGEQTLSSQTRVVGSGMRFYEYMQAPGMDLLTEYSREYDTAKQVSSVARQFDRKWRLTETYGCTGWDFPFAGHKALGDWQLALGINLRCQHLAWYTMEGAAKRDYPACIFYQSPWWAHYRNVEDYFARVNVAMTRSRPANPPCTEVALRYEFEVAVPPSGPLDLCLEQPARFQLALNGVALRTDAEHGWWTDRSLRRVPVDPGCLRTGANRITMHCAYDPDHPGLEIAYLLGAFGLRVKGHALTLTAPPRTSSSARSSNPWASGRTTTNSSPAG